MHMYMSKIIRSTLFACGLVVTTVASGQTVSAATITVECKTQAVTVPDTVDKAAACAPYGGLSSTTNAPNAGSSQITPQNFQTTMTAPDGDAAKKTSFSFNGKTTNVTIRDVLIEILKFLSVGVGLAVVGGVAAGGIVYATAQGSPGKTQTGIKIITNSVIALVLYLLMFAILQFLIPGGILK